MAKMDDLLAQMERAPESIKFADLVRLCEKLFGNPRQRGSSHVIFRTPWAGDPRINIQNDKGRAKAYQVRQVLKAIRKLEGMKDEG